MDNTILDSESEDFFITPSDYDVIIDCSPNIEDNIEDYMSEDNKDEG